MRNVNKTPIGNQCWLSIGEVRLTLKLHLVAKKYLQANFKFVEIANNVYKVTDKLRRQCNTDRKPMSGYRLKTSNLLQSST
jgi:hypothetical protein